MKKIIDSICIVTGIAIITIACSSDKKPKVVQSNDELLAEISAVKAIGKIIPSEDWAIIASTTPALIKKMWVKEGDTVQSGQILIQLDQGSSDLDIKQAEVKLSSIKAENTASFEDIQKAQLRLRELQDKYETSKRLIAQSAETREVMEADYSNWRQQESTLKGLQTLRKAQQIAEKEQQIQIQKAQKQATNFQITALKSGIIMDLTAKVGQSVNNTTELGKIINISQPIVEAEVDELFAQDVKIGQSVTVFPIGRKDISTVGQVYYTSPILSNKSILYETANEGEDRRVRKIKIRLNSNNKLAINAKVDCTIKVK